MFWHEVFWQEVAEARAEHERGESVIYDEVEALIADLGLERPRAKATKRQIVLSATGQG